MNLLVEYCRLSTTMTSLGSDPTALSSMERLGPIRDARPGNLTGMHAIGGVFGQKHSWHGCREVWWLIHSVFKEE